MADPTAFPLARKTGRYTIHATSTQPGQHITADIARAIPIIGTADTMGEALAQIKAAYVKGAAYACQRDTGPFIEPAPVTEAERAALGEIMPKVPGGFERGA